MSSCAHGVCVALTTVAPGSTLVVDRAVQMVNFSQAISSMHANHYHGRHNELYCGRLRTNARVCSPFQLLHQCDTAVNRQLHRALVLVVEFVAARDEVLEIDVPLADDLQAPLRHHFGLPLYLPHQ